MPESLGWQLRAALPPLRLHSVSLYDLQGEVLWLSEGALGPDEHGFVVEALDELRGNPSGTHRESDFHDGRGAVFLAVRAPRSELVGLVMILADAKALAGGGLAARIMTPTVHAILQRVAIWLYPASKAAADTPARAEPAAPDRPAAPALPAVPNRPAVPRPATSAAQAGPAAPSPKRAESSGTISLELLAPKQVDEILTFELPQAELPPGANVSETPPGAPTEPSRPEPSQAGASRAETSEPSGAEASRAGTSEPSRATPAEPRDPARELGLRVSELVKLRPGGRMRRFQLVTQGASSDTTLAGAPSGSAGAAQALAARLRELVAWLGANPQLAEVLPLTFSVSVPASAMEAEHWPGLVVECLQETGVRAEGIGFEIAESVYVSHRAQAERFVRTAEQLGSFLVADDFTFDSRALDLLRSKALRLLKVHPELVAAALRDKLAQARIVAISQAARVLGVHCSAKHVDSETTRRWLAAAGFDFAEGPLFDTPMTLASLAAALAESK